MGSQSQSKEGMRLAVGVWVLVVVVGYHSCVQGRAKPELLLHVSVQELAGRSLESKPPVSVQNAGAREAKQTSVPGNANYRTFLEGQSNGECKKDGECCDPIECIQSKTNCCCSGGEACRMVLEEGGYWCNYEKKKCANAGEECGGETGCCNDLQCGSGGKCEVPNKEPTCGLEGQTCGNYESTECCPNLECKENVCTKPPEGAKCDKEGEECSSSSNCCSGLRCVGSICTSKTGEPIVPGECKKDGECCDPIECIQSQTNCCCSGGPACSFVLEEGGYWCNYEKRTAQIQVKSVVVRLGAA